MSSRELDQNISSLTLIQVCIYVSANLYVYEEEYWLCVGLWSVYISNTCVSFLSTIESDSVQALLQVILNTWNQYFKVYHETFLTLSLCVYSVCTCRRQACFLMSSYYLLILKKPRTLPCRETERPTVVLKDRISHLNFRLLYLPANNFSWETPLNQTFFHSIWLQGWQKDINNANATATQDQTYF